MVAIIGDGSAMYGIQALWSAAQLNLPMTILILNNGGYVAMKHMAGLFQMDELVGCDLPGIDFCGLARALGCEAARVDRAEGLDDGLRQALGSDRPFLLEVMIAPTF